MTDRVAIKGARGGVRVVIDEACSWTDAFNDIQHQLTQNAALLNGVKVSFELGGRMLAETDMQALQAVITQHHVADFELQTDSRELRQLARSLGVTARPMGLRTESRTSDPLGGIVMRNLRNGQVLKHHGDLTLLGDVNGGAEVVATGSVVVFGRVRGMVYAGAAGNREAIICAIDLSATQIRIADVRARSPEEQGDKVPEIACIEGDRIVVHEWETYRR